MTSPGLQSIPAVPPSTPDGSFISQVPPPRLEKLDATSSDSDSNADSSSGSSAAVPPKSILRKSISSNVAVKRVQEAADNARRQVSKLCSHPAAVRTRETCATHAQNARELLGRSNAIVDAERITGIDRLILVFVGLLLFIALVPANLLGLAAPVTTAIVSVRPTYHSYRALTDEKEDVKHLLTFYVALGLFQTVEGCVPTWVLERIPRYYMCKLIILTYLGHPRFKGSSKLYDLRQKYVSRQPITQRQEEQQLQQSAPLDLEYEAKPLHLEVADADHTFSTSSPTSPWDHTVGRSRSPSPLAAFGVTVDTQLPEHKFVSSDTIGNEDEYSK